MSYLGRIEQKSSDIRRVNVTGSTSATHTLTWVAPSEQSLIITINGVKQQNNYTVSGTTLTLDAPLVATDAMEVVGILDMGETTIPGDDTVTTDKIRDDAVTADKLADSINTEIAANTAKVTNATHTGDVTGATALTIAAGAVDLAMLSATGTASATTYLRGDNAWEAISPGGITHASRWRLTTGFTGGVDPIASNLEVNDTSGYASLGAEMTESSGVFTFPATGFWWIFSQGCWSYSGSGASRYNLIQIKTTIDNGSNWVETGGGLQMLPTESAQHNATATNTYIFDVTNTSTHKVSFRSGVDDGSITVSGSSTEDNTCFTFIRLADT